MKTTFSSMKARFDSLSVDVTDEVARVVYADYTVEEFVVYFMIVGSHLDSFFSSKDLDRLFQAGLEDNVGPNSRNYFQMRAPTILSIYDLSKRMKDETGT